MEQKRTFIFIFLLLVIALVFLPFLVSFNDVLTRVVEKIGWYMWVQEKVVPMEIKMVAVLVSPLGIDFVAHRDSMTINGIHAGMSWNCLGWQSLLLLFITLFLGLRGNYTFVSKIEAILIGLLGTFLVNLLRIVFIVIILVLSRPLFAVVFHDYLAAIVTIIWLFAFWWFCYKFVLEEKGLDLKRRKA
jgi:exosortase/archaeosortase family protein